MKWFNTTAQGFSPGLFSETISWSKSAKLPGAYGAKHTPGYGGKFCFGLAQRKWDVVSKLAWLVRRFIETKENIL
jgi:hypothetical protein